MKEKSVKSQGKKVILKALKIVLPLAAAGIIGYAGYSLYRLNQLDDMNFEDMLAFTTKDKDEALISVGIVKDGEITFSVYGKDGVILPAEEHVYEIGSISKTFTAALLAKAVSQGKISLSDRIDMYLPLPKDKVYPTIGQLASHSSGYKSEYIDLRIVSNMLHSVNPFKGIGEDAMIKRLSETKTEGKEQPFKYSNFGMSVLGLVLEKVYGEKYTTLINSYCADELSLNDTKVLYESDELKNCWVWEENDAFIPAGAILSNISDMLLYARMNLEESPSYLSLAHEPIKDNESSNFIYDKMGIHIDSLGMAWVKDEEKNIIWHNGATGNYNSYMGFDKEKGLAVVILSNLPADFRIPATVMGPRLLSELQGT